MALVTEAEHGVANCWLFIGLSPSSRDAPFWALSLSYKRRREPKHFIHCLTMAPKAASKGAKKAASKAKAQRTGDKKTKEEEEGELQHLHLQGVEASAPRYWHFKQGHEHHEQLCERHL